MKIFNVWNISNVPSLISFNKYSGVDLCEYKIIRNDMCCEYCFSNVIERLSGIEEIEKVNSNFNEEDYYKQDCDSQNNVTINVFLIQIYYLLKILYKLIYSYQYEMGRIWRFIQNKTIWSKNNQNIVRVNSWKEIGKILLENKT